MALGLMVCPPLLAQMLALTSPLLLPVLTLPSCLAEHWSSGSDRRAVLLCHFSGMGE